jgi:hypothetical protein
MDVTQDPLYERMMERSYALDDWRARLVIAVLENAIHELLGYRSPDYIVRGAEDFIYKDNPMFDLAVEILGVDKDNLRERLAMMKMHGERMRRSSDGSGGLRG